MAVTLNERAFEYAKTLVNRGPGSASTTTSSSPSLTCTGCSTRYTQRREPAGKRVMAMRCSAALA